MKRAGFLARAATAALLARGLPALAKSSGKAKDPGLGFLHAGDDIVLKDLQIVPPSDAAAYANDVYYIATFTFTNDLGYALIPRIDHFVIEDSDRVTYNGVVSGDAALVGISNSDQLLNVGRSHDYTVGFRVPLQTMGTLLYDATF
ncbi:MAG: hypothetical protein ACREM2_05650 [Vulcanimicrobiaceae bacterium]